MVFSLLDNRLLAHHLREGGLYIPLGYPGVAKYATFGRPWKTWKLNAKEDGRRVAFAKRSVTWLEFPLTAALAKASTITFSLKSPAVQSLVVKINQAHLKPIRLDGGWQKVSFPISPNALVAGENRLELTWGAMQRMGSVKAAAAVEWIHLGQHEFDGSSTKSLVENRSLVLPSQGGLAYYLHPYKGTKLRVGLAPKTAEHRCDLVVRMVRANGTSVQQTRSEMAVAVGQTAETVVDLAPLADGEGRLELWAEGKTCQSLRITEPALVMPGAARTLKRAAAPKYMLFWMIDNARADRFSLYHPKTRVKTPVITELGKTGTVYAHAYIQGNESRVSHAAIWTGLYPKQHRLIDAKARLSQSWVTLPEALQKAGYYTTAWIANGFISKFWGFGEGWNHFRNNLHQGGGLSGGALANQTIEFIKSHKGGPFYIYVGTIDPHVSWRGREPWLKDYHPEPYHGPYKKVVWGKDVEKMAVGARHTSPADRKRIIAIYDSTVSYNDQQLGRVITALKEKGIFDETMIVITADHGEELWDYGKVGHGASIKQELVAVPLIIHYPPLFGQGVVVRQGVDVLSIMPTILDAVGAPIPEHVQGESLLPLAQGIGTEYPRPSIASQYELAHTLRLERWKIWVGGKGEPRLFDMESKEEEHREVGAKHPVALRWLTDCLSTFLLYQHKWHTSRWGVASNNLPAMARDLEEGNGPKSIRP